MSFKQLILQTEQRNERNIWFPPGWYYNEYDIFTNLKLAKSLKSKKNSLLTEDEKKIIENEKIIRSCYCTPEITLKVAVWFNGLFELDPFYNPYANTSLYAVENFTYLDGINGDGFDIKLWEPYKNIWFNPPFNRLKEAAEKLLEFLKENNNVKMAFICHLDMTSYFVDLLKLADYMIILNRVKFVPIPGLEVSQPTKSNALFIFGSDKNVDTGLITIESSEFYCVNLQNKEIKEIKEIT